MNLMLHAFHVGSHVRAHTPRISPRGIQRSRHGSIGVRGQAFLLCIVPFEDAIARYLCIEHGRHRRHFEIHVVGDEATAVAPTSRSSGEGHHVATPELKTTDAIRQFTIAEGFHIAAVAASGVAAACLACKARLGIAGQRRDVVAVGKHDGTAGVHLHLTVRAVDRCRPVHLDKRHPRADDCAWLHAGKYQHGPFVRDVHTASRGKRRRRRHLIIYGRGDGHRTRHLADCRRSVSLCGIGQQCHPAE